MLVPSLVRSAKELSKLKWPGGPLALAVERKPEKDYGEGALFLVPLRPGGYAVGAPAWMAPRDRVLLGYFFGPRVDPADEVDPSRLRAADAPWVSKFGDLNLYDGSWPILGRMPDWDRDAWPMPEFARRGIPGMPLSVVVIYDDANPNSQLQTIRVEDLGDRPDDGMAGAGFVEEILSRRLAPQLRRRRRAGSPASRIGRRPAADLRPAADRAI